MIAATLILALAAQPDPWISEDKALHLGAAATITAVGWAFGAELGGDPAPRFLAAAGLGLLAGAAKELVDLSGLGQPSWRDFTWSAVGAGLGLLVAWAIERWIEEPDPPLHLRF